MKKINVHSIQFKMVILVTLCVVTVGIIGNLYLYSFLNRIIYDKVNSIDRIYMDSMQRDIQEKFESLFDIGILCSNHYDIAKAMRNSDMKTVREKNDLLLAQKIMNNYITSTKAGEYVNKMVLFNEKSIVVQASGKSHALTTDREGIIEKYRLPDRKIDNRSTVFTWGKAVGEFDRDCFSILFKVNTLYYDAPDAYLYMEVSMDMVNDVVEPFIQLNHIFLRAGDEYITVNDGERDFALLLREKGQEDQEMLEVEGSHYKRYIRTVNYADVKLHHYVNMSELGIEDNITGTWIVVLLTSVLLSVTLTIVISHLLTKPISRLIDRIEKIKMNDFSYDPSIEQSKDEIGKIGKVVNEMVQSVVNLMKETTRVNDEKTRIEIAMLQAQVNPHFLYNTLDSIYWMAVVQKCPGICNITRSLSNLIKNMAKGVSDKVPLSEEIKLLEDYITIQSIRYLETFEFKLQVPEEFYRYTIIKLTLQPIVENAIFHGIEPAGRFGTVAVSAREDEKFLYIEVEDNGVGMTQEQMKDLFSIKTDSRKHMSGIGISNVNKRLKLIYGPDCGLSVESRLEEFTRITVKIRKEVEHV